ncbi:hypothetical protein EI94DRAFT_1815195 [Lactarius quietus]|nr:hypothetical protein EI94DRAFT_1815195 [Lactarius quietus]
MSQHPRSLRIQARSAKESKERNTPTGPPEAPMHSEEGSAFDFMQHIPSPITDAPPTTGHVEAAIIQSGGPMFAITVSSSSTLSIPMSGPPSILTPGLPSDASFTSSGQKCPAPYDFMDQIPASQRIACNLPLQHLLPRADIDECSDDTTADDNIPDSEEDLIQVRGIPTSTIEEGLAGPSVRFALPEGSPTEDVPLSDDWVLPDPTPLVQRRVGYPCSILTNLPPMPSGTPAFNAALDAEAEVLCRLLIDMRQMKKVLHNLNERLMRDYLILETLIMNIHKRPDDLEEPDI